CGLVCAPTRKRLKAPAGDPLEPQVQDEGSTAQAGNTLFHADGDRRPGVRPESKRINQLAIRIGRTRYCRQADDPVLRKLGEPFRENAEYLHIEIHISRFQRGMDFGFVPGGSEVAPAIDDVQVRALADPYRSLIGPCRNTEL